MEWRKPKTVRDVQCFLGFANFYRLIIQDYSKIATSLTRLTCKDKFKWNVGADQAFSKPQDCFHNNTNFYPSRFLKPFFLESDASNYALGAVLSQNGEDGRLHPIAFHLRKFTAAEINYEIYDK
jgi:hypothetical protein